MCGLPLPSHAIRSTSTSGIHLLVVLLTPHSSCLCDIFFSGSPHCASHAPQVLLEPGGATLDCPDLVHRSCLRFRVLALPALLQPRQLLRLLQCCQVGALSVKIVDFDANSILKICMFNMTPPQGLLRRLCDLQLLEPLLRVSWRGGQHHD